MNKDNTFKYTTFNDVGGTDVIEGKWSVYKDTLIINSNDQPEFKPSSVEEKIIPDLKKKVILAQNMDVFSSNTIISINEGELIDTLEFIQDSIFIVDTPPYLLFGTYVDIDSIGSIRIIGVRGWTDCILKKNLFVLKNPYSNYIRLYIEPYNHYDGMNYFTDTKWLIRNNKIYKWRNKDGKFDRESVLKKRRRTKKT